MKKINFLLFLFVAMFLAACGEENSDSSLTPKEKVKVFMSYSSTRGAGENTNQAVKQGDTINVQNVKDINIILSAETESGKAVDGVWSFFNIDNDQKFNNDTIVSNLPGGSTSGSVMSCKLSVLGLYIIHFKPKNGDDFFFYICHTGTPGIIGDSEDNDYAFRLDINGYQINASFSEGYTFYIKYQDGDFPSIDFIDANGLNPNKSENWHALVSCANNIFTSQNGISYQAKEFRLSKCKYSPGYVHFSLVSQTTPAINGQYGIYFYSGKFGVSYWTFPAVQKSDWEKDGKIIFQTLK